MTTSDMTDQMADETANVTPLHGDENVPGFRSPPHNFEAEMALLGAILVNNRSFERVQEFLLAEHFADPAHGRVYEACAHLIERGQIADPVTLKNYFKDDEDLQAIGGQAYIAELANAVITIQNAGDLGKEIYDCFLRRELIDIGDHVVNAAYEYEIDAPARSRSSAPRNAVPARRTGFRRNRISGFQERGHRRHRHGRRRLQARRRTGRGTDRVHRRGQPSRRVARSDLVIIAGRPSMGKTAFATNIAYNAASSKKLVEGPDGTDIEQSESVAFFSLEMSAEQLATRILSEQAHVRSDSILARGCARGRI